MNRKTIHFNSANDLGGAATEEVAEETQTIPQTTPATESHWDTVKKELDVKPADATPAVESKDAVTPPADAEKKEEPKPGDAPPATGDDDVLDVPDIVTPVDDGGESWKAVAIEAGITPPENPEDYKCFIENIKADKAKEYERGKAEASMPDPDKHGPDERELMDALKGGKKLVDFIEPLQKYNDTLSMTDNDIVELAYKTTSNWTSEMVADKMATLTPEEIAAHAKILRASVKTMRTNEYNKIVESGKKAWDAEKNRVEQKQKDESAAIIAELRSRKEFAGGKLESQHLDALVKNYESGKYHKELNTPKSIVDTILHTEFGAKRFDQLLKNAKKSSAIETAKKLSNSATEKGGSHSAHVDLIPKSHFEQVAEDLKGVKITGRTHG